MPADLQAAPGRVSAKLLFTEAPAQEKFSMHSHVRYEIYCFLEGDAYFTVEGAHYALAPGDLLLFCPGEVHHVVFRSSAPYRRIVANFDDLSPLPKDFADRLLRPFHDRPFGSFNRYAAAAFPGRNFAAALRALCDERNPLTVYTQLLALLGALGEAFSILKAEQPVPNETGERLGTKILSYLTAHLTEPLSLEKVAAHFYISKTHLNRIFRETTGATVWGYVTTKRLFLARTMLQRGMTASESALRAGFRDYPTFYRAYKKRFGEMPKALRSGQKKE